MRFQTKSRHSICGQTEAMSCRGTCLGGGRRAGEEHGNYNRAEGLIQAQHNNEDSRKTSGEKFLEGPLTTNQVMPTCMRTLVTIQHQEYGGKEKVLRRQRSSTGSTGEQTRDTAQARPALPHLRAASPDHTTDLLATLGPSKPSNTFTILMENYSQPRLLLSTNHQTGLR